MPPIGVSGLWAVFLKLGGWGILDSQWVVSVYLGGTVAMSGYLVGGVSISDTWWVEVGNTLWVEGVTQLQLLSTQPLSRSSFVHRLPTALSLSFIFNPYDIQGVFFNWYPPKKLKYGKSSTGVLLHI